MIEEEEEVADDDIEGAEEEELSPMEQPHGRRHARHHERGVDPQASGHNRRNGHRPVPQHRAE